MMKSLKARQSILSDTRKQREILEVNQSGSFSPVPFQQKLDEIGLYPFKPKSAEIFQVNIGKMCNQVCKHCHVDAGPDRKEIMTRETMLECLHALYETPGLKIVDLTGGAPEMNPDFRWFVEEIKKLGRHIIVRSNLTIILANKKYYDLPEFYKQHQVEVVCSLPCYTMNTTDSQRGDGVFEGSIKALQMLNAAGYGKEGDALILNLVYNPNGAFLPAPQEALEKDFKKELRERYGIEFNSLFTITNLPVSRFLDYLLQSGNYEMYMEKLLQAFNPAAAANVMCRNTLSVGWDGFLYDCDFNQMLDLKVACSAKHISGFNYEQLNNRNIMVGQHCYGCTAGSGSSCGGTVV